MNRAGVTRAGVKRAGVKRAGVTRAGVKRAGVNRAGVTRAGVTRAENSGSSTKRWSHFLPLTLGTIHSSGYREGDPLKCFCLIVGVIVSLPRHFSFWIHEVQCVGFSNFNARV